MSRAWRSHRGAISLLAALAVVGVLGASWSRAGGKKGAVDLSKIPPAAHRRIDFARDVKPIFARNCYKCHGAEKQKSDYRIDRKSSALTGGSIGGAIVPGDGAGSALVHYVAGADEETQMPPNGEMLSAEEVGILRAWIDQGAKWDVEVAATTQATHWALVPLKLPAVPEVKNKGWVRTPVDAFVLHELESRGMTPSAEADRRTLIRRVTFDLTGLPPTPEDVEAFIADPSKDAYERVVDRLLASPRYGERWARHWMDAVHYAESHGHDEDKFRPHEWPYRDYLIRSFNDDKPYGRFVEEQLAGDVLYPDDPQGVVATAFVAVGPWDQSSQKGILDGTVDKQAARYLDRDDMLTTTMSTFVSTTVHCARCHNHKFDPIPQADYYAVQAVFAGVDRIDRPYDPDPKVFAERRRLLAEQKALDEGTYPVSGLTSAEARREVAGWEAEQPVWQVLDAEQCTSAQGATLGKLADGSILSEGKRPEKDVSTIRGSTKLARVTAVRLEVLTDASLPHGGPGRQENGNLHLSEFEVETGPMIGAAGPGRRVELVNPSADFNQADWTIAKSIDGNRETAWGVFPEIGKPHVAVFELKTPLNVGARSLTFVLEQLHGGGHLIGRVRLSVTDAATPVRASSLPGEVAGALAAPAEKRSEAQWAALARYVMKARVARELAKLPAPQWVYAIASDFPAEGNFKPATTPRVVEVLRRGDVRQPIEAATPGALSCVAGLPSRFALANPQDEGSRRAALAKWVTDRGNMLTWRSIVNRVWYGHFGRGIVETLDDFGKMGAPPTHPELLDWLAVTFRDGGGSLKALHRLIVTSAAYRQSSAYDARFAAIDGENRYLWRMNRTRLDAESVHDAVLAISGRLDLTMGGPSVKQFIESKGVHETPNADYTGFDVDGAAARRRSIYRFVFRTVPDPFLQALDCPDASQLAPRREVSITALQALAMMNDRFVIRQSEHVAERLAEWPDLRSRVRAMYPLILGRPAEKDEVEAVLGYANKHGLANAVRMLLNSNEFMFVD